MADCTTFMVFSPFHLTLTQINSEMNCLAKNKCPESQKLDTRRRSENLIAISPRVTKSNNIVCTHYVKVFCILCLCIILFDTSKASENLTFILKQSLILSSFCTCVSIIICCLSTIPDLLNSFLGEISHRLGNV